MTILPKFGVMRKMVPRLREQPGVFVYGYRAGGLGFGGGHAALALMSRCLGKFTNHSIGKHVQMVSAVPNPTMPVLLDAETRQVLDVFRGRDEPGLRA
jgi:hypothetical protein